MRDPQPSLGVARSIVAPSIRRAETTETAPSCLYIGRSACSHRLSSRLAVAVDGHAVNCEQRYLLSLHHQAGCIGGGCRERLAGQVLPTIESERLAALRSCALSGRERIVPADYLGPDLASVDPEVAKIGPAMMFADPVASESPTGNALPSDHLTRANYSGGPDSSRRACQIDDVW